MSKITKWKSEKTKVKVVFRLQFHATHVPQAGWDKLFLSFIPTDTGKVTAKTTKANVRNGNCKWSDPVYETTRLLQDHGSKKYDDKLYKLVVAMGTSRSSILGDAIINLADYADAAKPVSISLPLQGCTFGTVLHVTVQLLTSRTGFREFEQQRELRERGIQMLTGSGIQHETDSKVAVFSEASDAQSEKASAKVRFKSDGGFPTLEVEGEMNEDIADSVVNADGSSCTSDSLYTEKHDNSSTHENESLKSAVSGDMGLLSNNQIPGLENVGVSVHQLVPQGSGDWVHGWCSNIALYNDSAAVYEENSKLKACLEAAQSSILDLKLEVSNLKAQTHDMVAETQNLAENLVVEIASGEELARTISALKLGCAKFKDDFGKFKLHHGNNKVVGPLIYANEQGGRIGVQYGNLSDVQNKYDQPEANWLHNLFVLEDKIKIIKEKACLRNLKSDLGLVADLESLEYLILGLRHTSHNLAYSLNAGLITVSDIRDPVKGLPESISLLEKTSGVAQFQKSEGITDVSLHHAGVLSTASVKQCDGQGLFHYSNVPNSMSVELDHDIFSEMKEKINGLSKELDESRAENNNLTKKMDQMESYYETLVHQLEESQQLMHAELQAIKDAHCSCVYTIATLESQAQKLQEENDEMFSRFLAEKHALSSVNLELEKRALASEMALTKLRKNYSFAVDQLLKDLETLSFQVLSMYETNEDLARQAFTDAAQPSLERCNDEWSEEACSPLVKFDSINTLLKGQHITQRYETEADDRNQKGSSQAKTVILESEGHVAVKARHGVESKDAYFNSSKVRNLQQTYKDKHYKLSKSQEDREVDNAYLNALNRKGGDLIPLLEQLSSEQTLLADQAVLVGKQLKVLSANNLLGCQKDETCIPGDFSKSAPESLISDKVEMEHRSENKELKRRMSELDFLLEETKHSLFLQGNLQQKSEIKLKDMEMLNLYLEIFSLVLLETVRGAQSEIMVMQGKHDELISQLQQSTSLKELLIVKLQAASDHVKVVQENEAKNNVRCDELAVKYEFIENNLQDLLNEKNVLNEKLKESEMRITDLVDYKHKYEACTLEKEEAKHLLEKENQEKVNLHNDILSLKSYLKTLKLNLDKELSLQDDREKTVASFKYRLENLRRKMSSFNESIGGGVTATNISKELDDKDIEEAFFHLEQLQQEACGKFLQLSQEKKDSENKLGHLESQITMIEGKAEADAKFLVKKLEESTARSEKIHGELSEMTKKYMLATEGAKNVLQDKTKLLEELSGIKLEMQSVFKERNILAQKVSSLESAAEELSQTKVILNDCISENKDLKFSLQSASEESSKQVKELVCLKETLRCLQDQLHSIGGSKEKLETELANLASQLNEKQHMDLKRQDELEFLLEETKVSLTLKEELLQKMGHEIADMERLNVYLETFCLVLHESLTRAHAGSMSLKDKNEVLVRQLEHTIESKELFMLKFQTALATIEALQESVTKSMAKYDNLILQNTALEEKMHHVVEENSHFAERFRDCEVIAMENLGYRQKYESCNAEKEKMQNLFEQENLQRVTLENEVLLLKESLKTVKLNLQKESSKGDDQEKLLAFLEGRLQELRKMLFFGEGTFEMAGTDLSMQLHGEDMRTIISHIEELLHKALDKFLQFHQEKKESEERCSIAQRSLKHAESEHLLEKEKFETDIKILTAKLDESSCKLEQLHFELVDMTSKYKIASEMEEKHVEEKRELAAEISDLKVALQSVTEDNKNLSLKVFSLENSIEELENYRKMLDNCTLENRSLSSSLQIARDESIQHMRELDCLKVRIEELRRKMFYFGDSNPVETATGLPKEFDCQDIETSISHVEELQCKAFKKYLQCYQEKKESEERRDFAQRSLENAESQLLLVKKKSEMDMQILINKLEESNAKLEQFHAELTDLWAKYKVASEMDEKHVEENMTLAAELSDLKIVLQSVTDEKKDLLQKVFTLENSSNEEIENTKQILSDYILENKRLSISLQTARDESVQQIKEMNYLKGRLQELRRKMFFFGESSAVETNAIDLPRELDCQDAEAFISDIEKLQHKALEKFLLCYQEKKETEEQWDLAQRSLKHAESQLLLVKEKSEMDMKILIANRDESSANLEQLHAELTDMASKYLVVSEIEEKLTEENRKLSVELSDMKVMLQSVTEENKNLLQKIFNLETSPYEEIENHKRILDNYISDNINLSISLQITRDESVQQMRDLDSLKEHCKCLEGEFHCVKKSKDELEAAFAHVTLELNEKHEQLASFSEQKAELVHLKKQVSDLLVENSNMRSLLLHYEECQEKLREDVSYAKSELCDLENNMIIAEESLLKADIEVVFLKSQLHSKIAELCNQIAVLQNHQMKLQLKLQATGMALDDQMAHEAQSLEQNARLTLDLLSSRSELNMPAAGRGFRDVSNDQPNVEICKNDNEIEHLNGIVMCLEEEAEVLRSSRDELDITNVIFLTKLDELNNHIACLNEYGDELNKLRIQHSELSQRLSEQVLKTEEFRNLSIHLQELKARTESSKVNERKTADAPSVASQESLRIAFIREQCDTKLQEVRSQLHLSRKHGEELLLKLQIALDELEARKKSEAICTRKNEDLSVRVLELEAELQSLLENMREKVKDNNQLNTELEVSRLSLICCKEEKEKLEISLQEYQNQRMQLLLELSSAKEKLEACTTCQSQQGSSVGGVLHGKQIYNSYNGTSSSDPLNSSNKDPLHREDSEAARAFLNEEIDPFPLGSAELKGTSPENSWLLLVSKGRQADEDREDLQPVNRHIQEKNLFSSMERLQKELEKMKNENLASLVDQNGHQTDMVYEEPFQREVSQLNMANEQLGRIFPQFNEFLESGNALERVLALEIELAEALKSKKKDAIHFQSSFLKQHHDEEAICKSFRDINELIKDMLELKKKNATVETDLKEMHNRYSQLSVQFAEVEGERQKLVMTLKNIRTTRKA